MDKGFPSSVGGARRSWPGGVGAGAAGGVDDADAEDGR
jgi:hypothetical protein